MKYQINHTNGKTLIMDDDSINNELSISMIGQNYKNYGNIFFDSFGKILNNFTNKIPPSNQIIGQFWYDTNDLNYYDGTDWQIFKNPTIDMSPYIIKTNDSMLGPLTLSEPNNSNGEVASTRGYVDSIKFKFKAEENALLSYVKYDNDYTIINTLIKLDSKKTAKVEFPFSMKDVNYSISLTKNSTVDGEESNEGSATYINSYKKTVNGFRVIANGTVGSIGCIIMGYSTNDLVALPKSSKVVVIQIADENGAHDDNFDIILNDTKIGYADLHEDLFNGSLLIASLDETLTFSSGDYPVPLENMVKYFFDPALLKTGDNKLTMKNAQNNNNGNAGILGIRSYDLDPDKTLSSPSKIVDLPYSGASGTSFDFTFKYDPTILE
jgi:hypothetical protein